MAYTYPSWRATHLASFIDGYARFAKLPRPRPEAVEWSHFLARLQSAMPFRLDGKLPARAGYFDPSQLQQVMINLVINGMEAMAPVTDRPRELLIRSQHEADQVLLAVQDSGTGVDPDNAEQMFDAFFTTKPSGMGMGLSISRSIIEAHGGRLWASPNAGPGATFQLSLPTDSKSES